MRSLIRCTLSVVVLAAGSACGQIVIQNGAAIDMTGSTGSQIVFPDGSVQSSAADSVAGHGGVNNTATGENAFIGGGNNNAATHKNAAISGGGNNTAGARYATIGGGQFNEASGNYATVNGGQYNFTEAKFGTIGGGGPTEPLEPTGTRNIVYDDFGTIGGGGGNQAGGDDANPTLQPYATIGGGRDNNATGSAATVSGGRFNTASRLGATVAGGGENTVSGEYAMVAGGWLNTASANFATVSGGSSNVAAGEFSFAAGRRVKIAAAHDGSFVFADQTAADFNSAAANEFAARATGGVRFITNAAGTAGQVIAAGGSSWGTPSSKALKENKRAIDSIAILEKLASIPVEEWNYIHEDDAIRHIGPYAEDFHAAFGLSGEFNGRITNQDFDGVELAAIQGLNQKLEAELSRLQARIDELEARLEASAP